MPLHANLPPRIYSPENIECLILSFPAGVMMSHHIEIFTGKCHLCKKVVDIVTIGKCATCKMDVTSVNAENPETAEKVKDYGITAVPTIVIDGRIKIVGIPDFPWFCGEEFYKFLDEKYPLLQTRK